MTLNLNLGPQGGTFETAFELLKEACAPLPGDNSAWPLDVVDDRGSAVLVLDQQSAPCAFLPPGRHHLKGNLKWGQLPQTLMVPDGFILNLTVNDSLINFPTLEKGAQNGATRLWLQKNQNIEAENQTEELEDSLRVEINRLIEDSQPITIITRLKLSVSGQPREVLLNILPPNTKAIALSSPLAAQMAENGLRVQVKPGVYEIFLTSRATGFIDSLGPVQGAFTEYWAFSARPDLRLVEISGARQIDSSQIDIYQPWQNFPIYVLGEGEGLTFNTIKRAGPDSAPDKLALNRECWLDYDGRGLSCRDELTGTMNSKWHLNVSKPFDLAQISLDNISQLITWQSDSQGQPSPGVQLRKSNLNLSADLRINDFKGFWPSSGWDSQLDFTRQSLNLPPGYHLFHVSGAEAQKIYGLGPGSWTGAWTTLDFFIVLIISVATWRLYGRYFGLLALGALLLCYHEPVAPRLIFLFMLTFLALQKVLPPKGKIIKLVHFCRFCFSLILIFFTASFVINQAKNTFYPQLDNPDLGAANLRHLETNSAAPLAFGFDREMAAPFSDLAMEAPHPTMMAKQAASPNKIAALSSLPDQKVQNSQPRPHWQWQKVLLLYSGAVTTEQSTRLYIYGPGFKRILGGVQIALISYFSLLLIGGANFLNFNKSPERPIRNKFFPTITLLLLVFMGFAATPKPLLANNFPEQALLDDYRQRLLTPETTPPPNISAMHLDLKPDTLTLTLTVESPRQKILILPSLDREIFYPERLSLNNQPLPLIESKGHWLALVPKGHSQITIEGHLKKVNNFQISFPSAATPKTATINTSPQWEVKAFDAQGRLASSILINSTGGAAASLNDDAPETPSVSTLFEPFFEVHRTISLGAQWQVHNQVRRLSPLGAPTTLQINLLNGESPLTSAIEATGGVANISFAPNESEISWHSTLAVSPALELKALDGPYSEIWSLDAAPFFRVKPQGLTATHYFDKGLWQPRWHPWAGETLTLTVDRPEAVIGEYLVIDQIYFHMESGENRQKSNLNFNLRTSQGGPYSFNLPPGAQGAQLSLNGRPIPTAQPVIGGALADELTLTVPLTAGEHQISVFWHMPKKVETWLKSPTINLGAGAANIVISMSIPENRWILWAFGPTQGPAVLFWPQLAILLVLSMLLGRIKTVPLKTKAWFLLGLGLMQFNLLALMVVLGWLLALGWRESSPLPPKPLVF
ncbi:MAG: hypothetical protein ACRCTY_04120, partial [Candidatus Adiutrix sp.]